jgi:hypothetical protein
MDLVYFPLGATKCKKNLIPFLGSFSELIAGVVLDYSYFQECIISIIEVNSIPVTFEEILKKAFNNSFFHNCKKKYSSNLVADLIIGELLTYTEQYEDWIFKIYFEDIPLIILDFPSLALDVSKACNNMIYLDIFAQEENILMVHRVVDLIEEDRDPVNIYVGNPSLLKSFHLSFFELSKLTISTTGFKNKPKKLQHINTLL